jgi:hypothetical protein
MPQPGARLRPVRCRLRTWSCHQQSVYHTYYKTPLDFPPGFSLKPEIQLDSTDWVPCDAAAKYQKMVWEANLETVQECIRESTTGDTEFPAGKKRGDVLMSR